MYVTYGRKVELLAGERLIGADVSAAAATVEAPVVVVERRLLVSQVALQQHLLHRVRDVIDAVFDLARCSSLAIPAPRASQRGAIAQARNTVKTTRYIKCTCVVTCIKAP